MPRLDAAGSDAPSVAILKQDTVAQGNRLSMLADATDQAGADGVAKDLSALDDALSRRRDPAFADFSARQRTYLRLTFSKLYFRFGCRNEAVEALEESLNVPPP
ncbi:MAG: tetratricopeptide repeat protein, partial [Bradyrhizobium sp.]|nr:tetratricopeptide repeat protein [Bradyrhizobium sp.]